MLQPSRSVRVNMRGKHLFATMIVLSALLGCATVSYKKLKPGTFDGSLIVMWVGEGDPKSGDGKFVFVPDPKSPLSFTRPGDGPGKVIKPGVMYTDGGSIPKIAQVFKGLSPWGYAPAYMIHDWIFTAHHCKVDNPDSKIYDEIEGVRFEDSIRILGEGIQTLVATKLVNQDDVAANAITWAVGSSVARHLWNVKGACTRDKVTDKHLAEIERAVPGSSGRPLDEMSIDIFREGRKAISPVKPAVIVTRLSF